MEIFAVSEAYEAPSMYFAALAGAEEYVAQQAEYLAAYQAWLAEDGGEDFDAPSHLPHPYYPHGDLFIDTIQVH